jgi:hypothetical protein
MAKRAKAIDRGWAVDSGDSNNVSRDTGHVAPKQPTCAADLSSLAILRLICRSANNGIPPEQLCHSYGFSGTRDDAEHIEWVRQLHRGDDGWTAEIFTAMYGEKAFWLMWPDIEGMRAAIEKVETLEQQAVRLAKLGHEKRMDFARRYPGYARRAGWSESEIEAAKNTPEPWEPTTYRTELRNGNGRTGTGDIHR